jgi:hypothetical protein
MSHSGTVTDSPAIREDDSPEVLLHAERADGAATVARDLNVQRFLQPDDVTCGPTCLRKVYDFYGLRVDMDEIVDALERNEDGGTLAVYLGMAARRRGLHARIYSYDLHIFDPTWAVLAPRELLERVRARDAYLTDAKRKRAAAAYGRFLEMNGEIAFDELSPALLKSIIDRGHPVLAGLSATYLYRFPRERWDPLSLQLVEDDVAGSPTGHFVVVSGYDHWGRRLTILDPSEHVPESDNGRVQVDSTRLINAIMLGDATYDAVLLELWPAQEGRAE